MLFLHAFLLVQFTDPSYLGMTRERGYGSKHIEGLIRLSMLNRIPKRTRVRRNRRCTEIQKLVT